MAKLETKVIAVGQSKDRLEKLKAAQEGIETISCDLSNWKEAEAKLGEICSKVDFLVNNAGLGNCVDIENMNEENIDEVLAVNLKCPMNLIRLVAKGMKERRFGSIVNVSSVASLAALDGHIVYSASKGGLDMVTKVAAKELGPFNVRVNAVNPTVVMTPMSEQYWSEPSRKKEMTSKIPMNKFVEVDQVVKPIIFLLSNASAMINGTLMPIDGGFVAT